MRDFDLLLRFLSEKGSGDWATFKDACRWIAHKAGADDDRAPIIASSLAALGHVEFRWTGDLAWTAAPPVLTMLPYAGGWAAFCGSRTSFGLARLEELAVEMMLWVETRPQSDGPAAVWVQANTVDQIEALAAAAGFGFTYLIAHQIAKVVPPLSSYLMLATEAPAPFGFEIERFSTATLEWVSVDADAGDGLYRYQTYQRPEYRWRRGGQMLSVPVEIGIYEALRWDRRPALIFRTEVRELLVPARARLPGLHARGLTLCSGALPRFERDVELSFEERTFPRAPFIAYRNVPQGIARRIAQSLQQPLATEASRLKSPGRPR